MAHFILIRRFTSTFIYFFSNIDKSYKMGNFCHQYIQSRYLRCFIMIYKVFVVD